MNRDLTWLHLLARQQLVNYPAAFTVWQEHYRTLLKEQDIQIYNRWYSTDCYQLQEPLDSILELILTQGGTAKSPWPMTKTLYEGIITLLTTRELVPGH